MSTSKEIAAREIRQLADPNGTVFPPELAGYAAMDVAAYLVEHWQDCQRDGSPLSAAERRGDIEDTIAVLRRWQDTIEGGTRPADRRCASCGEPLTLIGDYGVMVDEKIDAVVADRYTCPKGHTSLLVATTDLADDEADETECENCGQTFNANSVEECVFHDGAECADDSAILAGEDEKEGA